MSGPPERDNTISSSGSSSSSSSSSSSLSSSESVSSNSRIGGPHSSSVNAARNGSKRHVSFTNSRPRESPNARSSSKRQRISSADAHTALPETPEHLEPGELPANPPGKKKTVRQRTKPLETESGSNEPKKRKFGKRTRGTKANYKSVLKALFRHPWVKLENNDKESQPIATVANCSPPSQISMIQLMNWLFDIPSGGVDVVTYNYLFDILKAEGSLHYQKLSVNAYQLLLGNAGLNLHKWLHSSGTVAKKYSSALQPGLDRTEFNLLITETLPLVVKRVREMVAVAYSLCSIYRQSKSTTHFVDLNTDEIQIQPELYAVDSRTFSSYQEYKENFNFSEAVLEGILQRHLLARQIKTSQIAQQAGVINIDTFRYQDVCGNILFVWDQLQTEHSIAKACHEQMLTDIRLTATAQTTHTRLRNWICYVCEQKKIDIPGNKILMCSPVYSMVSDIISRHFQTPIHQKRPIKISIDVDVTLSAGLRTKRQSEERQQRRRKAAATKTPAVREEDEEHHTSPDQAVQNNATTYNPEHSNAEESAVFNDGGDSAGIAASADGDEEAEPESPDVEKEPSEMEDVYG